MTTTQTQTQEAQHRSYQQLARARLAELDREIEELRAEQDEAIRDLAAATLAVQAAGLC